MTDRNDKALLVKESEIKALTKKLKEFEKCYEQDPQAYYAIMAKGLKKKISILSKESADLAAEEHIAKAMNYTY